MNIFVWKLSKIAVQKKFFFLIFSLLRYRSMVFLPPLPEVRCPLFFEIQNPWGKVMERNGLGYEPFCLKIVSKRCAKISFFFFTFSTFEVPLNGLFAPISRSRMSNIFRDLESLGKSNGKKWSNIWTLLFESGLKSPRKKKFFCCWFCLTNHGGNHASRWIIGFLGILGPPSYGIGAIIRIGREMLCLPYAGFFHLVPGQSSWN